MDAVDPGGLGGTFAGNPVACAAALATLDVIEDERLLERATDIGRAVRERLDALGKRYSQVAEVRGLGAMIAMELHDAPPDARGRNLAKAIVDGALVRGLILLTAGPKASTVRFLIPLLASDADVTRGLDIFEEACASALGESRSQN